MGVVSGRGVALQRQTPSFRVRRASLIFRRDRKTVATPASQATFPLTEANELEAMSHLIDDDSKLVNPRPRRNQFKRPCRDPGRSMIKAR
jgi:hypothetical protein